MIYFKKLSALTHSILFAIFYQKKFPLQLINKFSTCYSSFVVIK